MKSESHFDDNRSVSTMVGRIVGDMQQLLRQEVALAKTEIKQEWKQAKKAAVLFGASSVLLLFGAGLLVLAMVFGLEATGIVPLWASFGIFALLFVGVGLMVLGKGKEEVKSIDVVPKETVETMRENVEWLKKQM